MITNSQSGTNIEEIATGIFRINTPVALPGNQKFNFNQYLIVDDAPMLFHTGLRKLFPLVSEAISAVDSPQTKAPPPRLILMSNEKSVPRI